MAQGVLPFKYEKEKIKSGMTSLAGLPPYLELAQVAELRKSIQKHIQVRNTQGYTDSQMVLSLVLLNLAGGDCMEDLNALEADEGFCQFLRQTQLAGLPRRERRAMARRWRKEKRRTAPSPSAGFSYLGAFHDEEQEKLRQAHKAFIPARNRSLQGFAKVNGDFVGFVQSRNPQKTATLDMDAVLIETNKDESQHCYKGFKSYQPLTRIIRAL